MSDDKKRPQDTNKNSKNILGKIINTIRTESISLRDAVMESAGFNQFERQIAEAETNLDEAKQALTEAMAHELQASRLVKITTDKIYQQELKVVDTLGEGDEAAAFKLATELVELEQDLATQQQIKHSHALHLGHLTLQMENAERMLKDLQRQMTVVNTTERIHKATDVITKNFDQADIKLLSAKTSLERIRKKQQQVDAQYELAEQVEHQGHSKLSQAERILQEDKLTAAKQTLKSLTDKE